MNDKIADRFARETAEHELTVLHDDGLYRHLRFRSPKSGMYWFDLITVPGVLIFRGDGDSFVFARDTDMFAFFRGSAWKGEPNPQYWAEKLTSGRGQVMKYDQDLLDAHVKDAVQQYYEGETIPDGLDDAVRSEVLGEFIGDESIDRQAVDSFEFYANDSDRYAWPKKDPDFRFTDTWEWSVQDYDWWYLWACQAIVWGIAYHDTGTRPTLPEPKVSAPAAPRTEESKHRGVVDVHLPELQEVSR